jgi:PHD/YefM family antitoxin component YafN of YafNO toxin-antitoxin module
MSLEVFSSYEETAYPLRNPRYAERPMKVIDKFATGKRAEAEP